MQQAETTPANKSGRIKRILQVLVNMALWTAIIFISAGRLNWLRGWICVVVNVLCMTAAGIMVRLRNPGLLTARSKWRRKDTKRFDKVFLAIFVPLAFLHPAIAGLDVVHFGWSHIPFTAVYPGIALFIFAMALVTWAMVVNPHAETSVRIQTDRGHTVVSSGPYRFVRHPMYVGAILMYPGASLILGSLWAMAMAVVIAVLFIARTALEDRTLRRELPGYEEYAAVTRYRLLPGIW